MRKINLSDLTEHINNNRNNVNKKILESKSSQRPIRTRERDTQESEVLGILCKQNWDKAVKEGKVKYISERRWYYEFD